MGSCWWGTLWETDPWSNVVFEKEVIFHKFDFETSELDFEVSKSSIWKHTTSCVFSFIIISQLRRPIEVKRSQVFLFYAYVEIQQVRRLSSVNSVQCL